MFFLWRPGGPHWATWVYSQLAHVTHVVKYNGPRHKSRWVENEQVLALIILGDSCIPELQFTMEIASVQL